MNTSSKQPNPVCLNQYTTLCGYIETLRQEVNALEKALSALQGKLMPVLSEPYPTGPCPPKEADNPRSPQSIEVVSITKDVLSLNRIVCDLTDRLDLP